MNLFQSVLLGLVEGITEFLPVSSTAHLLVFEKIFGIDEPSLFFNTVVQLGALGAVAVYFRKRLMELFIATINFLVRTVRGEQEISVANLPTGLNILIATLPVFIVGFLAKDLIRTFHQSSFLIGVTSITVAALLWYAQRIVKQRPNSRIGARELLTMGMYQILALVPGVSRSGIVMVGGLMQGLSFERVLEYSFLMSLPALGGAGIFELISVVGQDLPQELLVSTLVASVVAFASALVAIHFLITLVRRAGFMPFVIYRLFFGIFVLML